MSRTIIHPPANRLFCTDETLVRGIVRDWKSWPRETLSDAAAARRDADFDRYPRADGETLEMLAQIRALKLDTGPAPRSGAGVRSLLMQIRSLKIT